VVTCEDDRAMTAQFEKENMTSKGNNTVAKTANEEQQDANSH